MSLFHPGKGKNGKKKGKSPSNHKEPQRNTNPQKNKSVSDYPDYEKLTREEAKALLAQRIHDKTGGATQFDASFPRALIKIRNFKWQKIWNSLLAPNRNAYISEKGISYPCWLRQLFL